MYYLHQFDTARDGIIVVDEKPTTESITLIVNGEPMVYEDGSVVKAKPGWTLGPVTTRNEAEVLALTIAARYNWDVEIDGQLQHLPQGYMTPAQMGAKGGSRKSANKSASSRENGKKGGRPRKNGE